MTTRTRRSKLPLLVPNVTLFPDTGNIAAFTTQIQTGIAIQCSYLLATACQYLAPVLQHHYNCRGFDILLFHILIVFETLLNHDSFTSVYVEALGYGFAVELATAKVVPGILVILNFEFWILN